MTNREDTSTQTKLPSNIRFTKLGKIVMIAFSLIWVVSEIVLLFGLKDSNQAWIRVIQIAVSAIPFVFLNHFIKEIIIQAMKQLKLVSNDNSPDSEKDANSKVFIYIMAVIFLVGGVVRGAVDAFGNNDPTTTTEVITTTTSRDTEPTILPTKPQITKFDFFSGDPEQYDIYFKDVDEEKYLIDLLENTLRNIYEEEPVLNTELNETFYGDLKEETEEFKKELNEKLDDSEMKGKRILKTINTIIIDNLLKMDDEYEIPENRQEIADAYIVSADNELGVSRLSDYENAVKYLWGSLYVSISWNEYNPEIIDSLVDAYDNLAEHNPGQSDKVTKIQTALRVIRNARFVSNPVEPLGIK